MMTEFPLLQLELQHILGGGKGLAAHLASSTSASVNQPFWEYISAVKLHESGQSAKHLLIKALDHATDELLRTLIEFRLREFDADESALPYVFKQANEFHELLKHVRDPILAERYIGDIVNANASALESIHGSDEAVGMLETITIYTNILITRFNKHDLICKNQEYFKRLMALKDTQDPLQFLANQGNYCNLLWAIAKHYLNVCGFSRDNDHLNGSTKIKEVAHMGMELSLSLADNMQKASRHSNYGNMMSVIADASVGRFALLYLIFRRCNIRHSASDWAHDSYKRFIKTIVAAQSSFAKTSETGQNDLNVLREKLQRNVELTGLISHDDISIMSLVVGLLESLKRRSLCPDAAILKVDAVVNFDPMLQSFPEGMLSNFGGMYYNLYELLVGCLVLQRLLASKVVDSDVFDGIIDELLAQVISSVKPEQIGNSDKPLLCETVDISHLVGLEERLEFMKSKYQLPIAK